MPNYIVTRSDAADAALKRYSYSARRSRMTTRRSDWEFRKTSKKQERTPAEIAERKAINEEKNKVKIEKIDSAVEAIKKMAKDFWQETGYRTEDWWLRAILQRGHEVRKRRNISDWNAWQHMVRNQRAEEGLPPLQAPALASVARVEWQQMTREEQVEKTKDAKEHLNERRNAKRTAVHNVPIAAFHDVRASLATIKGLLIDLYNRTEMQLLLIAVRSKYMDFFIPTVISSTLVPERFFMTAYNEDVSDFAKRLESHILQGAGSTMTYEEEMTLLANKTAAFIFRSLQHAARPDKLGRMYYTDFGSHITRKFGIVYEGWPLKGGLCSPHKVGSRIELETLYNAWEGGTARFRRLSNEEFDAWLAERDAAAAAADLPAASPTPAAPAVPAVPAVPTVPAVPIASTVPAVPTASTVSAVPIASTVPAVPNASAVPAVPDPSAVPAASGVPSIPSFPVLWPSPTAMPGPMPTPLTAFPVPQVPDGAPASQNIVISFATGTAKPAKPRKTRSDRGRPRGSKGAGGRST